MPTTVFTEMKSIMRYSHMAQVSLAAGILQEYKKHFFKTDTEIGNETSRVNLKPLFKDQLWGL